MADYLQQWLSERGHQVEHKGHNLWLWSEAPNDKPTLLLNAHIDTVRPAASYTRDPFTPVIEDGVFYGLGSNDDGGSLVALIAAFEALTKKSQPYRLLLTLTAEEEISGTGGLEMILPEIGPVAFGVIGEPTEMHPAVAEKGLLVLDCTAKGVSGHAARDTGVNAIYEALPAIEWFRTHTFPRISPFLGAVKMTVTQINAGTQHNVVPDHCDFVVDVRPNGLYTNAELLAAICEAQPSLSIKARSTRLNSSSLSELHPFVQRALALGRHPFGSPTLSNQAVAPFPTIKIGPGCYERSHTADEFIRLSEIEEGIRLYIQLLDTLTL